MNNKNTEILKEITNQELANEIERRIKSKQWWIGTMEDGDGHSFEMEVIDNLTWKENTEHKRLELSKLLEWQNDEDERLRIENFKRDNARKEVWEQIENLIDFSYAKLDSGAVKLYCKECNEKIETIFVHWPPYLKEDLSNLEDCVRLSKLERAWEKHLFNGCGKGLGAIETEFEKKFGDYKEWLKNKNHDWNYDWKWGWY